jgi:hypothetical protein
MPRNPRTALEIPAVIKKRLGLDSDRSWVIFSEANRFRWPGPDLRALPAQDISTSVYGMLPPRFFEKLKVEFLEAVKSKRASIVPRTE